MTNYTNLLNDSGLKATYQRLQILDTIEKYGHLTIDSIYEIVSKVQTSLSLATVYKNIILMVEKGVLIELAIKGQKSKYELTKESHIHLICTHCGAIEDKEYNDEIKALLVRAVEGRDFTPNNQQLNFYGTCQNCG